MSRLDSFIRRMTAQRDCLGAAAALAVDIPGLVLELGLGNGRSYDHIRQLMPGREIYVFDRRVAAHPDCRPDDDHLMLGEILDQLPIAEGRLGRCVALAHSDIGTGHPEHDAEVAIVLAERLAPLMVPGGLIVSDQRLLGESFEVLTPPASVPRDRYFMCRYVSPSGLS